MSECQMFLEVGRASYVCQLTTISVQFYTEIAIYPLIRRQEKFFCT